MLSLTGCTILKYTPLQMLDNTEYTGFIYFTDDEPCKSGVGILCLKGCKILGTDSIFT
jgi:hypothetical protein